MYKFVATVINFVGVWIVASVINGVFSATLLLLANDSFTEETFNKSGLAILISFVASIPFVGLVWVVTIIAQAGGKKGFALFQLILAATITTSIIAAIFFYNVFYGEFKQVTSLAAAGVVIAATTSVLLFNKQFKKEI